MSDEQPRSMPLSPSALLESIAARLERLHGGTDGLLVRAVPVKAPGQGRVYGGFVYARLRDASTGEEIDARVPEQLAAALEWNRDTVFVGLLRFKSGRGGVLKPEFRIDSVAELGASRLPARGKLIERWRDAAARPKRDIGAALAGERPRVVVVTGVGSVAVDDIRSQLREAEGEIALEVVRVAVTRPAEVARALRQASDASLVVLTRGGGEGVEALDAEQLIGAVASSAVPVAVGHAPDDLVLGRVADASFPTPTAFGAWLRVAIDDHRAHRRRAEEAETLLRSQEVLDQLRDLRAAASWWRLVALVAAAGLVALVLWHLIRPL